MIVYVIFTVFSPVQNTLVNTVVYREKNIYSKKERTLSCLPSGESLWQIPKEGLSGIKAYILHGHSKAHNVICCGDRKLS